MEELELREYWAIIRKRIGMVILIPVISALASAAVSIFVLKPEYAANTTLLVNQKPTANQGVQYDAILANEALVNTYTAIIKSQTIEQSVIDKLHLPYTTKTLDGMIQVSSPTQSQVIQVTVTAPRQPLAVRIANALAKDFQFKARSLMDVENVQIVDPAIPAANPSPVKPNKKLNVAIAFILGLMVSVGLAFLLEYLDNRVRSEEDVQRYLKLPVLGTILDYSEGD
ncbi:MAG: capsular biosynthesis protein [Alicyclobacillus sp.]|nr:capsular biosynthesis protein [Alicyclobacillus sp.]